MRLQAVGVVLCLGLGSVSCGEQQASAGVLPLSSSESAATTCWSATWSEGSGENAWWVEYAITGTTVTGAYLEVPGQGIVPLSFAWGKWGGGSTFAISTGTTVIAHATNDAGQTAQTLPFAYMVNHAPAAASCTTTSCSDWDPTWAQGSGANTWWIEYAVLPGAGESVSAVSLEVGGRSIELTSTYGKWVGPTATEIPQGTQVVAHAVSASGQTAQTAPFAYLVDHAPATETCGNGGGGGGCPPLQTGLVTLTFDDGWAGQYTVARQQLLTHHMRGTFYIVTRAIAEHWVGYLNGSQLLELVGDGDEIGSHTVDHPRIETLSDADLDVQLSASKQWLEANITSPIAQFASPYGVIDARLVSAAKRYYQSYRTTTAGLNFRGDDPYALKADPVQSTMALGDVHALIDAARTQKGWRILLFHDFTSAASSDDPYVYPAPQFGSVLDAISASGLEVVTVGEGIARMHCP